VSTFFQGGWQLSRDVRHHVMEGFFMRLLNGLLCLFVVSLCACSQNQTVSSASLEGHEHVIPWPDDWADLLGKTVTLEGIAANAKLGALVEGKENAIIWIDALDSWPEGFYPNHGQGKRLRVTGIVIKRADMPVFVQRPGELPEAGIPVKSEEELKKAKWRYLLKDAKWDVLE
jgi:hypothetical protein